MISKLIAHKLTKNIGETSVSPKLKDSTLDNTSSAASSLYGSTMKTIRRSGAVGNFRRVAEGVKQEFEQLLEKYTETQTDESFVSFSHSALDLLSDKIREIHHATGGFLVFMQFKTSHHDDNHIGDLLVALISETDAPQFNDDLDLQESAILDLGSLKHCARIKLDLLTNNAETMITFLSGKNTTEVSKYFIDFIGCDRTTSSRDASNALMSRINAWCDELPAERNKRDIQQAIWDFWKNNEGSRRGINLSELSNSLAPSDPESLLDFLTSEDSQLTGDLPPIPSRYMSKFANFKFKGDGITLEYQRHLWDGKVDYNDEDDVVYISEPPAALVEKIQNDDEE